MNAIALKSQDSTEIRIGGATIVLDGDAAEETIITIRRPSLVAKPHLRADRPTLKVPALGEPFGGGFYAGPWPHDTTRGIVVSHVSGDKGSLTWSEAQEYCKAFRDGDFDDWCAPDRLTALALFERLGPGVTSVAAFKKGGTQAFSEEVYWTSQEYQFHPDFAWGQYFVYGHSNPWSKYAKNRVRPVRIVPIQ